MQDGLPLTAGTTQDPLTPPDCPHSTPPEWDRGQLEREKCWAYKQVHDYSLKVHIFCPRNHTSDSKARPSPPHPVHRALHHLPDSMETLHLNSYPKGRGEKLHEEMLYVRNYVVIKIMVMGKWILLR